MGHRLAPLLEEAHALAATVRAPQIAAARAVVAALLRAMVAVAAATDARTSAGGSKRKMNEMDDAGDETKGWKRKEIGQPSKVLWLHNSYSPEV